MTLALYGYFIYPIQYEYSALERIWVRHCRSWLAMLAS